jgi:hypothetical protein
MWIFLLVIFFLSCLHQAMNLSLYGKTRNILYFCLFIAAVGLAMFRFSIRINFMSIAALLNDANGLALACTCQIIESAIFMLAVFAQIRAHYEDKTAFSANLVGLLPSGIFLVGVFFSETYLFNIVNDMRFVGLALVFSAALAGALFIAGFSLRKLIPRWEWRMELKIILSFLQIVLAMCLPLLLMGLKIQGTQLKVEEFGPVFTAWGFLALIVMMGLCGRLRWQRRFRL